MSLWWLPLVAMSVCERFPSMSRCSSRRIARWGGVLLAASFGCGPTIPEVGETGSSEASGSALGSSSAESPVDSTTGSPGSTGTTGPGLPPAESTETFSDEGPDDVYTCGCDDTVPVGMNDDIGDGFSAASVIEQLDGSQAAWRWVAFEDSPTETTLQVELSYEGGEILHGPGGGDGCNFLDSPCDPALRVPVAVHLTTEDGLMDAAFSAPLDVDLDEHFGALRVEGIVLPAMIQDPLLERIQALGIRLEDVYVRIDWELDGAWDEVLLLARGDGTYDELGYLIE